MVITFTTLLVLCVVFCNSSYGFSTTNNIIIRRPDRSIIQEDSYRDYCNGCNRPLPQCLCEHLPEEKIGLDTKVLVLQHPVEFRRKTISTVPLLTLVLDECRVLVGRSFDVELETIIHGACNEGRMPLLLFPGPNATVLEDSNAMEQLKSAHYNSSDTIAEFGPAKYLLIIVDEPTNVKTDEASKHLLDSLRSMIFTQLKYEETHLQKNPDLVRNSSKLKAKKERQKNILSTSFSRTEDNTGDDAILPDGYKLRPLLESDAEFVDSRWPYRSKKSLVMIRKQIVADNRNSTRTGFGSTCLGIEHRGRLVACIMRHTNGSIGILHVDEDHRRQRLGEMLLSSATKALQQNDVAAFAFILEGNTASESLFTKMGWEKMYSGKKGTGKRRAKRLWEFKAE
eukprot:scaffold2258_cov144-Skeletonema_menzelii.AAC.15